MNYDFFFTPKGKKRQQFKTVMLYRAYAFRPL